jgi:hypothetical protein
MFFLLWNSGFVTPTIDGIPAASVGASVLWDNIYNSCSNILLEPGGLQLGLFTRDQFNSLANEVLIDFMGKTQAIQRIVNVPIVLGTAAYPKPSQLGELRTVLAAQTYLHETSGDFLDNSNAFWHGEVEQPTMYREDEIPIQQVELSPTPNVTGDTVRTNTAGYGVIAAVSNPVDFDYQANPYAVGYGTQASFDGNPYVDVVGPGYGVLASFVPSTGNLTMVGATIAVDLTYIQFIPASFRPYLKYGILSHVFASDNELKDEQKAAYCQARYAEGVNLACAIMADLFMEGVSNG